jgi:hypothetical protein
MILCIGEGTGNIWMRNGKSRDTHTHAEGIGGKYLDTVFQAKRNRLGLVKPLLLLGKQLVNLLYQLSSFCGSCSLVACSQSSCQRSFFSPCIKREFIQNPLQRPSSRMSLSLKVECS